MNSVEISGNLARDPVVRSTKTGRAVASFTVASSRLYVSQNGEQKEQTAWINVVAWGAIAERVANFCRKGTFVYIHGRSPPMRGAWIEILWYNMVNEIAESYPLVRSRLPQNLKFEESRPKAVGGLFSLPNFTY